MSWLDNLHYDAIEPLLNGGHTAIEYWTKKDLLKRKMPPPKEVLWNLKIPQSILRKQNADGSWTYPGKPPRSKTDYGLFETYRQLGFLIEMFGLTKEHPAIEKAATYVFSKQTAEGDIRGIYGNQYSANYTAGLTELLIKAGYAGDKRVDKIFAWFDGIKQVDGGWAIPLRTLNLKLEALNDEHTWQPDKTKPFSHLITGVVLRAYAVHPIYSKTKIAKHASELVASRFFERDVYSDRNRVEDWTGFSFPFWFTDLTSALDTIGLINPKIDGVKIGRAKEWFVEHQQPDGLFAGHLLKDRYHDLQLWHSYATCRAFSRLSDK